MIQHKNYITFFDLDMTILSKNSGSVLVREAYKSGLMSTSDLLNAIYLSYLYKFNLRNTAMIILKMGKWLKGLRVDKVTELSEHVVNNYLVDAIRPEIYSEINFHKEHYAEIVILSSAMMEICNPIGSRLGCDNIICTRMEAVDGVLTGLPAGNFCFGDEKRYQMLAFCNQKNYDPLKCYYYGDSISDVPVFKVVGNPVCVNPDKKLKRLALEKGWRINNW